ncbi:MAG: SpoIIE family protein phosphatase [Acidobacteriota bacterium]|nr:SpoIIE family protein phosphatase [Acidobacteriota bacterium]
MAVCRCLALWLTALFSLVQAGEKLNVTVSRVTLEPGAVISVTALLQDHYGFIWVGTSQGLYRYDGTDSAFFSAFRGDSSSLSDNVITTLYQDSKNRIWVGTKEGLNLYKTFDQSFNNLIHDPENTEWIGGNQIHAVTEDAYGNMWMAHENGVDRFNEENGELVHYGQHWEDDRGFLGKACTSLFQDKDGSLWAGGEGGLYFYDYEEDRFIFYSLEDAGLEDAYIRKINQGPNGLEFLAGNRAYKFDFKRSKAYPARFSSGRNLDTRGLSINDAIRDKRNGLWMASNSGLVYFNRKTGKLVAFRHSANRIDTISYDEVNCLLFDRSGILWVGTSNGLNKIMPRRSNFSHHARDFSKPRAGLPDNDINGFLMDRDGILWVVTKSGLCYQERGEEGFVPVFLGPGAGRLSRRPPFARSKEEFLAITEAGNRDLFVLTNKGVYRYNKRKEQAKRWVKPAKDPNGNARVPAFMVYQQGYLWLAYQKGSPALYRVDPFNGEAKPIPQVASKPGSGKIGRITAMAADKEGYLWFGSPNTLSKLDPATGSYLRFPLVDEDESKEFELNITSLYQDKDGRIWYGTQWGLGVLLDEKERETKHFFRSDGLPENDIYGIAGDRFGHLWISHRKGITRFNPREGASVTYDMADGLNNKLKPGLVYQDRSGEIFFGGWNGFNRFNPDRFVVNETPPKVIFSKFESNNSESVSRTPLWEYDSLKLGPKDRKVKFTAAALDYTYPRKNLYSFKLAGRPWTTPSTDRYFMIEGLGEGTWKLKVKGANSDGVWSEKPAEVTITVKGPIWRSRMALILYAILIPTVLFIGYRLKMRKLHRRQAELETLVSQRTYSLLQEKEKTEIQARKLMEMDRLKTEFFSNVSHEFRTPLTLIIGPLESRVAEAARDGDETERRRHEVMLRNARRLLRLINQLLDISKLEAGKMRLKARPGDPAGFARPIIAAFRSLADKKELSLEMVDETGGAILYFDPEKLEKILFNLISNAFQFTPAGGKITLLLSREQENGSEWIRISVSDTGVGIPEADLPFIFDRFRQADGSTTRESEGTGIGLSLVKELVELHDGQVSIESVEGKGTKVGFKLPMGKAHLQPEQITERPLEEQVVIPESRARVEMAALETADHAGSPEDLTQGLGETILVVDDHPDVRTYIRQHFSDQYRVVEAVDGRHGLEMAEKHRPDLVISDVMMPNLDGYGMCRRLKAHREMCHVPVILLTARASDDMKVEGLEIGADDYLSKPFNIRELQVRVRNLLAIRGQERSLRKSLEMAHRAQVAMLPTEVPRISGLDIATFSQPAREVGGDYFDFVPHTDKKLGVVIGDVSGKGMPAALYMTMTKGLIQAVQGKDVSPKEALTYINGQFHRASDAHSFISLLYVVIDPDQRGLVYCSAGHTPMVYRNGGKTELLRSRGMAVGLDDGRLFNEIVENHHVGFMPGDVFVLYTDGISEGMNEDREVFGEQRLVDLVSRNGHLAASDLLTSIRHEYQLFVGNEEQFDDMTAVVIKVR